MDAETTVSIPAAGEDSKECSSTMPSSSSEGAVRARDPIQSVCSSSALDDFLATSSGLNISYHVPRSGSVDFVSEATTIMPVAELEPQVSGIMAGLGIKRKGTGMKDLSKASKKPKTLSEKRLVLEEEIAKFGIATVEKMYPRQHCGQTKNLATNRRMSAAGQKNSPIKMKPKPPGLDFEEVDARHILKPLSHDKYIHEPAYDSVVYITRRNGIVPLSSLCRDANTVLPSNVRLLQGRNVRLGKPNTFIKDRNRLVALGGSRNKTHGHSINIVKVPKLIRDRRDHACVPFEMDSEYARFAVEALSVPKKSSKVDIRTLKKLKKAEKEADQTQLSGRNIVNRLFDKLQKASEVEAESESGDSKDSREEEQQQEEQEEVIHDPSPAEETSEPVAKSQQEEEEAEEPDDTGCSNKIRPNSATGSSKVHNHWSESNETMPAPLPDIENKPIRTEEFRQKFEQRKKNPVAGLECDVEDCFCREQEEMTSTFPTELPTPVSGSQTPSAVAQHDSLGKEGARKVKSKLNKVKRALKSLGVNFYEFDDSMEANAAVPRECSKEFCQLGCVCDAIASKPIPPTHCGKVECMLRCFCSEDAVKFASSRKVGISPAGAANLRSSSQRHMAAEERKFHNTVVATTSGQDLVMLGSSGRQKRERKVPSRYQDSDTLMLDSVGKEYIGKVSGGDIDDYMGTDPTVARLIDEGLRDNTMKKCAVVVPLIELPPDTNAWCMFHCQYSCPCSSLKDPLDYGPDKSVGPKLGPKSRRTTPSKDIGQDRPGPKSSKIKSKEVDTTSTCARTAGHVIRPSNRIRMPHKIVQSKISPKQQQGVGKRDDGKVPCKKNGGKRRDSSESRAGFGLITGVSTITPNSKYLGTLLEDTPPINLAMQPKGSIQYARWNVLKQDLAADKISVYCFMRAHRSLVFVCRATESPYVTNADNIKKLHPSRFKSLPPTIESLLSESSEDDMSRYAILTHNGIAWEITGVLQKKKAVEESKKAVVEESKKSKVATGPNFPAHAMPLADQQPQAAIIVASDTAVMKLPLGQSLVTMQRQGHQTMQIKLPPTNPDQHWCTIRVDNADGGSIQCPDSNMALKCMVLKQAAQLSMKEDTTVRIPIAVPGEVSTFGVYAVPGLSTHVFVGPFSNQQQKSASTEVICLDSPPSREAEDEVQVIPSFSGQRRRKQQLKQRPDVTEETGKQVPDKAVSSGEERKLNRQVIRSRIVSGQVPLVVDKEETDEVVLIDSSDDDDDDDESASRPRHEADFAHSISYPAVAPPYLNLKSSDFGKVVVKKSKDEKGPNGGQVLQVGNTLVTVTAKPNGIVTFLHPNYTEHEVYCASMEDARKWVQEFDSCEGSKKVIDAPNKVKESSTDQQQPEFKLQLRPLSSLVAKQSSQSTQVALDRGGTAVKRMQEIVRADGKKGLAIVLENRQSKKEMTKLFYNLGLFFPSSMSHQQILQKATDESLHLCARDKELQQEKRTLMLQRKKLFEDFTNALKGLPIEIKKQKLQELKNVVKKRDDQTAPEQKMPPYECSSPSPPVRLHAATDQQQQFFHGVALQQQQPMSMTRSIIGRDQEYFPSADHMASNGPTPYSDVTGLKTVKKDGKVLRPMNAFMLWAKDHRRTLIANGYDGATVSKMLADEWKVLTDEHKQKYYLESERLKNLHQLQHPNYKYSPRARKNAKRGGKGAPGYSTGAQHQPKRIAPAPPPRFMNVVTTSGMMGSSNPIMTFNTPIRIPQAPAFLQQPNFAAAALQSIGSLQIPIMSNQLPQQQLPGGDRPEIETIAID